MGIRLDLTGIHLFALSTLTVDFPQFSFHFYLLYDDILLMMFGRRFES